mmetsp:Transcript_16817/g.48312  ORF Transcript_16817/g.48312 Transcript_16817/m.48312 type:complete len:1261 (+) Transcript_16817:43-3825(+)
MTIAHGTMADKSDLLKKRLGAMNAEKERDKAKVDAALEQLNRLCKTAPKKPKGSPEAMDTKLEELEASRTRSSLPLAEEKALLRQMQVVRKEKRSLDEYDRHEQKIQQQKAELEKLRGIYRQKLEAISELDTMLAKFQLAQRLDCSPNDLQSRSVLCPKQKLGQVIGRSGANVRLIEEMTGVQIDVDKEENRIHLSGSEAALERAVQEVEAIAHSVDKTVPVSKATMNYLTASKRLGMLDKFRAKHRVRINFVEGVSAVTLSGIPERIATAEEDLDTMQVQSLSMILTSREASMIVGKGGSTVNALTDKHGVAIVINKDKIGDSATVIVDGLSLAAEAALAEIETMVAANKDVEEFVDIHPMHRQMLLSGSAEGIATLQAAINKDMTLHKDAVRLTFRKDYEGKGSKLLIRTKQIHAARAKELAEQLIDELNSDCITLHAPLAALPQIVGRGGQMVKKLRSLGAGGEIEIEKETGCIHILANNAEEREKIKVGVEAIIDKNHVREIPIEKFLIGRVLGGPGKDLRAEMTRIGVSYRMNPADTHIVLRGAKDQVDQCAVLILDFLGSNHLEEFEIPPEDEKILFQGENGLTRRVEKEHHVAAIYRKSERRLYIRGKEDNVKSAAQHIKQVLVGGDGFAVVRMSLPDGTVGTLVGKGGKNVKAIEAEHEGVTIQISDASISPPILTMRGPEEKVEEARSKILASLATTKVVDSVPISSEQKETLENAPSVIRDIATDANSQMTLMESSVRIRGVSSDVRYAKGLLMETLTGSYKSYIDFEAGQYSVISSAVTKDPSHFERIRKSTETDLALDEEAKAICILGKRSNVKKAKALLFDFLEFVLSSSMERVKVEKPFMKTMADAEGLADIAAASGASISLDRDLSFVIIQSSDSGKVETAFKLVSARIVEHGRLVDVHKLDQSEAWLLPNIIGKGGSTIRSLETNSGCSVEVSKEELTIVIRGKDEVKVAAVKVKLFEVIDNLKRECLFIDIPDQAQLAFIGKSGEHINFLRDEHNVTIDVMKKPNGRLQVQGSESNILAAKTAIDVWRKEWEGQNIGESVAVEGTDIPAIIGSKGSVINGIQKDFGVKVDIDRDAGMLTIRGGKTSEERNGAAERINDIVRQHHDDVEARKAAAASKAEKERREKAAAGSGASDTNKKGNSLESGVDNSRKSRSNEFSSVPVGMTVTASTKSAAKKKERGTIEGRNLFALLVASSTGVPSNVHTDEHWDSSTVSSAAVSTNGQDASLEGRTHYKCISGFSVRL